MFASRLHLLGYKNAIPQYHTEREGEREMSMISTDLCQTNFSMVVRWKVRSVSSSWLGLSKAFFSSTSLSPMAFLSRNLLIFSSRCLAMACRSCRARHCNYRSFVSSCLHCTSVLQMTKRYTRHSVSKGKVRTLITWTTMMRFPNHLTPNLPFHSCCMVLKRSFSNNTMFEGNESKINDNKISVL